MKMKVMMAGFMAATLAVTACPLPIRVACPSDSTAAGIKVTVYDDGVKVGEGVTDSI